MKNQLEEWVKQQVAEINGQKPPHDLLVTELRKAIRLEPGDYVVLVDIVKESGIVAHRLLEIGETLWDQGIRLYVVTVTNPDSVRFLKVESPQTLQVEEK